MSSQTGVALGILAGGAGRRMGGIDKGWLDVQGTPAVTAVVAALPGQCASVLISANRHQHRYARLGIAGLRFGNRNHPAEPARTEHRW